MDALSIAMLSIHSSPLGPLGTRDTGGMSVVVREMAGELGKNGYCVDIFTAARNRQGTDAIDLSPNVRLVWLDAGLDESVAKDGLFGHLPAYFREMESFRKRSGAEYDLIHSHYWLSGFVGREAQQAWDLPHVMTFHTLGLLKNRSGANESETDLRVAWERRLARSSHRVLVGTLREKDHLVRHFQTPESRIGIVPFGVNLETFRPMGQSRARRRFGMDPEEVVLLFVGRFVPLKGIERLMAATARLVSRFPLRLVLVGGDGPNAESTRRLERLATDLRIAGNVTFAGRIDHPDLNLVYSAADLLVMPSFYESFGLVALEALACGTPVAATPVGFVDTVIRSGRNGIVIDDPSPSGIAESIEQALDWRRSGKLTTDAVRESVAAYGWSAVARRLTAEYVTAIDDATFAEVGGISAG